MAKTAKKQPVRGRPFKPGQSGNPRGRPKGALGKRTLLMRQLEASDPIDLLKGEHAVSKALTRYYGSRRRVFTEQDIQLGTKLVIAISDQMCAMAELVRMAQAQKAKRSTKAENDTRAP